MGIQRKNGYSATVEGFFVYEGERIRLAKTNGSSFVMVEPRALPAGAAGELLIIIDGQKDAKPITLPRGARSDEFETAYEVAASF